MSGRVLCPVFCWLLIQLSSANLVYSQEYSWKYFTVSDGLPQTQIFSLYQDSKGFIWIGTKGGLSRFDGIDFQNFTFNEGLEGDFINKIQGDDTGGIYVTTNTGIYYQKDDEFRLIRSENVKNNMDCVRDKNGLLLVISDQNLKLFSKNGEAVLESELMQLTTELQNSAVHIIHNELDGDIIITTLDGTFFRWDGEKIYTIYKGGENIRPEFGMDGELYAYDLDSLYIFQSGRFSPILSISGLVVKKIVHRSEIYLSNAYNSTRLFQYDGERIFEFHQRFNMVIRVLLDDESNLWVGTESGLWLLQSKAFQNFLTTKIDNFYTWAVAEDRNENFLFASFLHGLKKYDGKSFTDIPVNQFFREDGWQFFYSGSYVDENGDILLGTVNGILKYDGIRLDWYYKTEISAVLYIYHDNETRHYLITTSHQGLVTIDKKGTLIQTEGRQPKDNTGLETSVLRDKFGRIWLSGKQGISIKENGKWRNLPDDRDSINVGAISMIMDSWGNLWLGSNDGLYHYDYKKLRKIEGQLFRQQIGILNITDQNELLIGSIKGIGLLSLEDFYIDGDEKIRYFDENNGFLGTECKHNASYKDKRGHIWICTSDRVVKVSPKDLKSNPNPPRVYIRSISAPSATMEWEPVLNIYDTDIVHTLSANHDDIRFNYHAISHTAPMGVHYQTMLQGYDSEWSAASPERYRTYTKLPPGHYTFKVKAANIDGVWTEEPTAISIEILPEWHERMSVKIGGVLAAIVSASIFGFLYSEQLRRKKVIAEGNAKKMTQLQINSMKRLIDPHFTFNAINSIAAMVYKENREEAYTYFTKFSKLIRSVFDASEETTRTIKEELAFIEDYLDIEKMRFKERFDYKIEIAPQVNYDWKIPKMIVQIYVENSIKHGLIARDSGGMIEVKLDTDANFLIIKVGDNGIGRKSGMQNKSNPDSLGRGTSIMREYFNLLNKYNEEKITSETIDLKDADGHPAGTEVQLFIPLNFKYNL